MGMSGSALERCSLPASVLTAVRKFEVSKLGTLQMQLDFFWRLYACQLCVSGKVL